METLTYNWNFSKISCWKFSASTIKSLGKWKTSKNSLIKKFTSPFDLILLNTTHLSNSFYGQTSLKDTIFLVLIYGVKLFLVGLRNAPIDSYIFSVWYKLIHFSVPLNPTIHRMRIASNILCRRCKEQEESQPYFVYFLQAFQNYSETSSVK